MKPEANGSGRAWLMAVLLMLAAPVTVSAQQSERLGGAAATGTGTTAPGALNGGSGGSNDSGGAATMGGTSTGGTSMGGGVGLRPNSMPAGRPAASPGDGTGAARPGGSGGGSGGSGSALNNMRANGTALYMSPDPRAPNVSGRPAPRR
ncbi:hypothetical protein LJ656_18480 [Paraburkholderia sp. MMS20-SJTR3]|uniref:Uncharacterized protein n=1 Tax=Paraburkholderia sejongensis TaxID=2886946 RepID=A0ABS8JXE8_9BURK|nr:hypothetical protein [Paraburkholderia sp. MMS20-SJTR3]MCC8394581.1 hypothetical protein [Paraburkholderia sp. MMS20-SJTR3]